MKRLITVRLFLFLYCASSLAAVTGIHNEPDSAYLFSYATTKNREHNGLHFAWSIDRENWHSIGNEYGFLRSDFGRWGSQKRMLSPVVLQDKKGVWHCLFSVNENDGVFAHAESPDLVNWRPQSYPYIIHEGNCLSIEVGYSTPNDNYFISWVSNKDGEHKIYATTTKDFRTYTSVTEVPEAARVNMRDIVCVEGEEQTGIVQKVSWQVIDGLINACALADYKNKIHGETAATDPIRFAALKPIDATIITRPEERKPISDMLIGIFFEDINYAADGGIYAELIQNRGFEYSPADKGGNDKSWNHTKSWTLKGDKTIFTIDTIVPLHPNNKHYALLQINRHGAALANEGFDGIPVTTGDKYNFSMFTRLLEGKGGKFIIRLVDTNGNSCGETTVKASSAVWKKYESTLTATRTVIDAHLEIIPQFTGKVALDMISLFPQKTFKGRKNGLRQDLAQTLADLKPRFVRFPGGCVAHGDGLENMYRWKNTIGPLEARKPQRNLWGYHQTAGLGYYEYFQFCEDIGAEPLPVVPAGVPCQNSGTGGHGQQCGIPMNQMQNYIQEIFDLIEWANGDSKTTVWGRERAKAGHPKPFNLKYLGIGNEDLISDVFEERYTMICNAVREKYPDIIIIGTVGPFWEGSDYEEGWRIATEINLPMVDEHYYNPPGWYIHNQDYYDRYDRNKSKVYLGEYAAHLPGRPNNIETALAEALHLANVERNGDVVRLTSYAPLLAKEKYTQWNPDLIYFNNTEVKPTVGYHVQYLYGNNSGDEYLASHVQLSNHSQDVKKRVTTSVVKDNISGDYIVKIINMLPVSMNTTVDLEPLGQINSTGVLTVLSGKPDDRTARPVTQEVQLANKFVKELPAYSFTVLRVRGVNK